MKETKIIKTDFLQLDENNVMFITNPGRMGDEDGITFIVKNNDEFITYRVDGWMYPTIDINSDEYISLKDAENQFPKWRDSWENKGNNKYTYLYMGFGNGLSVDNSIYNEYKPYLDKEVKEYLEKNNINENAAIYNVWKQAVFKMINKEITIKKSVK